MSPLPPLVRPPHPVAAALRDVSCAARDRQSATYVTHAAGGVSTGGEPRRPCPEIPADHHFTRYNAGAHRWYPNKLCGSPPLYAPCKFTFDLLILKVVSESRVTWAISVPILVFLGLSVLDLGPMYATDRQTSDAHHRLMAPTIGAGA